MKTLTSAELPMKFYLVHCGFYDEQISNGIYEFHVNIPLLAIDVEDAKRKIRLNNHFIERKMHIDGIHLIESVDGYSILFQKVEANSSSVGDLNS